MITFIIWLVWFWAGAMVFVKHSGVTKRMNFFEEVLCAPVICLIWIFCAIGMIVLGIYDYIFNRGKQQ